MDHVVIPLDADHETAVDTLVAEACDATATARPTQSIRHVTLASFEGAAPSQARAAVEAVAARTAPFVIHAHGYGLFAGEHPTDLNLHVSVIRAPVLEALRADLHGALAGVGARLAPWVGPGEWSPHITLIGGQLAADELARVVAQLLCRHHPSWRIPVGELALTTSRGADRSWDRVALSPVPSSP